MSLLKKRNSFEESLREKLSEQEFKPSDSLWDRLENELDGDSFEPAVREKMEQLHVQPSSGTWEKIEAKLPLEHKHKFIYFWLPALLLSALGLGFWLNQTLNSSQLALQNQAQVSAQAPTLANPKPAKPNAEVQTNNSIAESSQLSPEPNASIPAVSENTSIQPETQANSTKTSTSEKLTSSSSPASLPLERTRKTQVSISNQVEKTKATPSRRKNSSRSNQANNSGNSAANAAQAGIGIASHALSGQASNAGLIPAPKSSEPGSEIPSATGEANSPKPKLAGRILSEEKEPIRLEDQQIKFDKDSVVHQSEAHSENYETDGDVPGKFAIIAMAGFNYTAMQLAMPSSSPYNLDKSFALREALEKASFDWSGGFLLSYQVSSKWELSTGVQILNVRQSLHYNLEDANGNPNHIQPSSLYLHPNDSIVEGQVKVLDNKYSFTEIPIWIHYSLGKGEVWSGEIMAGYSFGLLSSVNMYMPDPSCIGLLNANDKNSFPKFKSVHFVNLAPLISWKMNNTIQLGLMPQVKIGLNSMVDNSNWISQKPYAAGLQVLIRKRF